MNGKCIKHHLQTNKMNSPNFHEKTLTHGLKNMGYSPAEAIADLIDNSIEAKAKNIEIFFWEGSQNPSVFIVDDGEGMTNDELNNAIKIKKKYYAEDSEIKLSKFGFGLKTASFSQCEKLTIITKKKNNTYFRTINSNLENIETNLLSIFSRISYVEKRFNERCKTSGTIIIWEDLDNNLTGINSGIKKSHSVFFENGKKFTEHAAIHFHNFLDNVNIYFNNVKLENWNPFEINLKGLKTFDEKKIHLDNHFVTIKGYLYPKEYAVEDLELYEKISGPYGWFDSQGIYLYREKRLLTHGGWFGLRKGGSNPWKKETKFERCRITLHYDSELDDYFKPNIQKNTSQIPHVIRHEITNYCEIIRSEALQRNIYQVQTNELIESSENILQKDEQGKIEINIQHTNIQILLKKNMSPLKKEFVISQISKELKKLT